MQCQLVTWSNLSLSLYGHRPQPNCNGRQSQIYYQAFQNRMTNRQFELKHECICTCYALFGIHVLAGVNGSIDACQALNFGALKHMHLLFCICKVQTISM